MSCGCNEGRNGAAVNGGGGAAEQWTCVVEIDWIAEFNAQGAVDLNSSGATLTDQAGVEWHTPSVGAPFNEPGNQVWDALPRYPPAERC